jgi:type II secretory ATPase GspE/PulE/Tfp pilus assembly ATPase PilB-like protein
VVAQRLARRLCTECREPYWPSDEELALLGLLEHKGKVFLHRAKGCGRCGGTGYRGRVALYEVMPVTREVRALLESGTDEIHQAAIREGMTTLHQDGVRLCIQGVSSLEEIHRVAGERR